ncbi:hypothetical protein [Edwardsiella hoshinae]|uniref:hypothetical protein n=1 Tax=Edwardsiella hoshinae TaxID=93378 RepID=UPI0012EB01A0|nr:hypothetical protein [Edwardsiella hoshinae]
MLLGCVWDWGEALRTHCCQAALMCRWPKGGAVRDGYSLAGGGGVHVAGMGEGDGSVWE